MRAPDPGHTDPHRFPAVPVDGGVRVYFVRDAEIVGEGRIVGGFNLHGQGRIEVSPLDQRAKALLPERMIFDRLTGQAFRPIDGFDDLFVVSRRLVDQNRAPRRFNLQSV